MASYPHKARERAMKVEEVILRAVGGQITFWQAAQILRYSPRHLRRGLLRAGGQLSGRAVRVGAYVGTGGAGARPWRRRIVFTVSNMISRSSPRVMCLM